MKMKPKIEFKLPSSLTKEQQKIIYTGLMVFAFFVCFWVLIYGPQSKRLSRLKSELARTEDQIAEISRLAPGGDLVGAVRALKIKLDSVTGQFPSQDEVVIRDILEGARRLKIDVDNVNPGEIKPIDTEVKGYVISEFPISMHLSCDYRTLGEYLYALRKDFPVLVKLKQLDIKGNGEGRLNLDINLQILAYLASEKK